MHIDETVTAVLGLLTPEQWKTWLFLIVITSAMTETAKRVFFLRMASVKRKRFVYATAFVVGAMAAYFGYATVGTEWTPVYYWAMFGVTAGPLANFLHWVTLGAIAWKFPGLADALKGKR